MPIPFHTICRDAIRLLILAAAICSGVGEQPAFSQGTHQRVVSLQTLPLTTPIGDVRKISLSGSLEQGGEIVLDGNEYTASDRFGDFSSNSAVFFPPVAVEFRQVDAKDPAGQRRKIYEIVGNLRPPKSRYYIVSPSRKSGDYRLVVDQPGEERRVIALEEMSSPPAPTARIERIVKVDHALLQTDPPMLVVQVTGQTGTANWSEAKLMRRAYVTPPADGIWEFDLFATPPAGNPPAQNTSIQAIHRWRDFDAAAVKGLRVYGTGDGIVEVQF